MFWYCDKTLLVTLLPLLKSVTTSHSYCIPYWNGGLRQNCRRAGSRGGAPRRPRRQVPPGEEDAQHRGQRPPRGLLLPARPQGRRRAHRQVPGQGGCIVCEGWSNRMNLGNHCLSIILVDCFTLAQGVIITSFKLITYLIRSLSPRRAAKKFEPPSGCQASSL